MAMNVANGKKVSLDLEGLDGNAMMLLGAFGKQAKREGWEQSEIDAVRKLATSGDYDHLLQTLMAHCE